MFITVSLHYHCLFFSVYRFPSNLFSVSIMQVTFLFLLNPWDPTELRGFNKYRRPTKRVGYFASPIYDELSRSTDMSCFSYTRSTSGYLQYYDNKCLVLSCLVFLHKRCISVNFFLRFFVGLRRICLCANVLNFEYQHLFIACKN